MQFDLVSDLHLDLWDENTKDWKGIGTSLCCVVAGDVSRNPKLTVSFLKHLCEAYSHVIFVDGNHEHYRHYHDLETNEYAIEDALANNSNFHYLADSSLVVDGTAFVGTNGWWTFDFPEIAGVGNKIEAMDAFCAKENYAMRDAINVWTAAQEHAEFLGEVVMNLQDNDDIHEIVIVTHTVPRIDLIPISPGSNLVDWAKIGNSSMQEVLNYDIEGKISTWCFGHYHPYHCDIMLDGVRYVSHPRGRPSDAISPVYYPKKIDTELDTVLIR